MPTLFANQVNKIPHNVDKHAGFHGSPLTLRSISLYPLIPRGAAWCDCAYNSVFAGLFFYTVRILQADHPSSIMSVSQ